MIEVEDLTTFGAQADAIGEAMGQLAAGDEVMHGSGEKRELQTPGSMRAIHILLVLGLSFGCTRHPAPMAPTAAALVVTPFCVPMLVVDGDVEVVARVCLDSSWACGRVRAAADRWGYLAGIVEVGVCADEDAP